MNDLEILRKAFVAFIDGLWWGLRDNTGALSMYEGYSGGFRQMGKEIAKASGGRGPEKSAEITGSVFRAIGMDIEVNERDVFVKACPIWNRILERGLEFSFHVEEICWMPLLEGIGEVTKATPVAESSLRLIHIENTKIEYKKEKARTALERGDSTKAEYEKQIGVLDKTLESAKKYGHYRFE
ncbi:MAG: hypothetical protein C4K48_09295 [Candidatus Thorarchaeota archaeon]|nr:MAG: hypothetical protein C4K48_09295 [Candidatus Thorarchaeota archaeon]